MQTKFFRNWLTAFLVLVACSSCGALGILVSDHSKALAYFGFALTVCALCATLGAYYEERCARREKHERELTKLAKKKGIEF